MEKQGNARTPPWQLSRSWELGTKLLLKQQLNTILKVIVWSIDEAWEKGNPPLLPF